MKSIFSPNLKPYIDIHKIEIEITTNCNILCEDCDRRIATAPLNYNMPSKMIDDFVKKSIDINHRFKSIHILGGEPTLHPEIIDILEKLQILKIKHHTFIKIISNAYSKKSNLLLDYMHKKNLCYIERSLKPQACERFDKMDVVNDNPRICIIPRVCGIAYTFNGFYICGAGAAIDRVLSFNIGIKNLSDITINKFKNMIPILCKYCGHSDSDIKLNKNFWGKAYKKYKQENKNGTKNLSGYIN